MDYSNAKQAAFLENTRLLYRGIRKMYQMYLLDDHSTYQAAENDLPINIFVRQSFEKCFPAKVKFKGSPNGQPYRYQNPLAQLFLFMLTDRPSEFPSTSAKDSKEECIAEISNILQLYDTVMQIRDTDSKESMPRLFGQLCNDMRDIAHSGICYLLYSQKDQTEQLSTSDIPEKMLPHQFSTDQFSMIRTFIQMTRKQKNSPFYPHPGNLSSISSLASEDLSEKSFSVAQTLYIPRRDDFNSPVAVIVLDLDRYSKESDQKEWIYLVFQYESDSDFLRPENYRTCLRDARNILFLRQDILECCVSNIQSLLLAQRSFQYVDPLNKLGTVRILHLTDLHLDNTIRPFAENWLDNPGLPKEKFDLLVITGDIVQSNQSAGMLEQNYDLAADFIRRLASHLWKEDPDADAHANVRADWKKRVIIIPGNHDYAAMNELQVTSIPGIRRSTGAGYPSRNEGGPMVKFAYYIAFLNKLLGTDISTLLENDLDQIRVYRQLGISVLMINTVSQASALRNNKVLFKVDKVNKLLSSADLSSTIPLLLCHHSPHYVPNYLLDYYYDSTLLNVYGNPKTVEERVNYFYSIIENLYTIFNSALPSSPPPSDTDFAEVRNQLDYLYDNLMQCGRNHKPPISESELREKNFMSDICSIRSALDDYPYRSEHILNIVIRLWRDHYMAVEDQNILHDNFKELLKETHFQFILSGHTHTFYALPQTTLSYEADILRVYSVTI